MQLELLYWIPKRKLLFGWWILWQILEFPIQSVVRLNFRQFWCVEIHFCENIMKNSPVLQGWPRRKELVLLPGEIWRQWQMHSGETNLPWADLSLNVLGHQWKWSFCIFVLRWEDIYIFNWENKTIFNFHWN